MPEIDYNKEFFKHLREFLTILCEYTKLDGVKDMLSKFNVLTQSKVIAHFVKKTKNLSQQIKNKDASIFSTKFNIFPGIDMNLVWNKLDNLNKEKIWIYLHLLFITSTKTMLATASTMSTGPVCSTEATSDNTASETTASSDVLSSDNFNPFIGIKTGKNNANYNINDLYSGPKVLPGQETTSVSGFDLSSFTQGIGIEKYIDELSDQLKNINKNDIDTALNQIKTHLGTSLDEKTSGVISNIITDISDELKNSDLSKGNVIQNLSGIAMNVAQRLTPKLQSSDLDKDQMQKSFMNLLSKCQPDSNATNSTGPNPLNMLYQMVDKMKNIPSSSTNTNTGANTGTNTSDCVTTETQQLENISVECNKMLKNLGCDIDIKNFGAK